MCIAILPSFLVLLSAFVFFFRLLFFCAFSDISLSIRFGPCGWSSAIRFSIFPIHASSCQFKLTLISIRLFSGHCTCDFGRPSQRSSLHLRRAFNRNCIHHPSYAVQRALLTLVLCSTTLTMHEHRPCSSYLIEEAAVHNPHDAPFHFFFIFFSFINPFKPSIENRTGHRPLICRHSFLPKPNFSFLSKRKELC